MARCDGKGYPGCDSCINRELDPFQCETCEDESNWEGEGDGDDGSEDLAEELSLSDLRGLCGGFE